MLIGAPADHQDAHHGTGRSRQTFAFGQPPELLDASVNVSVLDSRDACPVTHAHSARAESREG